MKYIKHERKILLNMQNYYAQTWEIAVIRAFKYSIDREIDLGLINLQPTL